MSTLVLRYLPLIVLRLIWRRAGLVCHVDALPHRGRCHCFFRNLFDYGQRWSLLIIALIVVLLPLSLLTTPTVYAARLARSSTRSARRASAAAMLRKQPPSSCG